MKLGCPKADAHSRRRPLRIESASSRNFRSLPESGRLYREAEVADCSHSLEDSALDHRCWEKQLFVTSSSVCWIR